MMSYRYQQICFSIALLSIYCILLYFILTHHQKLDFSSFYSTVHALLQGENPYKDLTATYLPTNNQLSANLNPPIVLWLFNPLAYLSYSTALLVWSAISLVLGFLGAVIVFRYAFSTVFLRNNYLNVSLLYFAFFATLMNVTTLQLGTLLFFFIMVGYYFYLRHRDCLAGIFWGMIIAMKLFPALLFFYVLKQKRFKVLVVMIITLIIAWLIPLLVYGVTIYKQYYFMMSGVFWYGDGWNASIYGFICRLLHYSGSENHLLFIKMLYLFCFCILIVWYLKALGANESGPVNHQPFCLTLAMMLFLSPLGWVYYFPLLILPLILTWFVALNSKDIKMILFWFLCFFLVNFPMDYVKTQDMPNLWGRVSFFSSYFYGLLFLIYLLGKRKKIYGNNEIQEHGMQNDFMPVLVIILAFGLFIPTICFVMRLLKLDLYLVTG
ncbi:glycosyltransferase family 87 protein [Legionella sainthelensi]|uniref:glycosyltransferase family 87 protein n=1 Tax=Legionella sainthelensi TaxID=28087 RepID=UPI000E20C026|nr:glycosyltransferase family 87 protein [Legionella sainthelensi]